MTGMSVINNCDQCHETSILFCSVTNVFLAQAVASIALQQNHGLKHHSFLSSLTHSFIHFTSVIYSTPPPARTGNGFAQKKPFQIVRQSMPYGNLHDKAGLFFIGYAAAPDNFEYMLSNMVGGGIDAHSDDVMRLTECVKGTYWYFPGLDELKKLA